ncbi:hypothetical protein POJ06DRAFT_247894 [Lipomyces tetrasporus]|uniref:Uncharacterized protein n=1 Tax=Lipomyces tetrasporus TaxID=54092 RepID=A0AAD7QUK2_9ASCO|nr:uncharacterized protein POJ06DRAFT_247894 [Lipomyces tetrasporus]KAJ8101787.1 hypothetical protein POJ06DRAFT_247894 [Lipomyces tetrasporus]
MSRRLLLRIMPPVVAGMAGVYSGFAFFDPIFREERDRLIREGIIVLPDNQHPSNGQEQGTSTQITPPAPPSVPTETVIQPVTPPIVSPEISSPNAQPIKSFQYYLSHPLELFSSRGQNTSRDSTLKEDSKVAIDQVAAEESKPTAGLSTDTDKH